MTNHHSPDLTTTTCCGKPVNDLPPADFAVQLTTLPGWPITCQENQ